MAEITYPDKGSKVASKAIRKAYLKGQPGKSALQDLVNFLTAVMPLGTGFYGSQGLINQLYGPAGAGGGLVGQAIAQQQSMIPAYAEAVQRGLSGDFFDISPYEDYAYRQLQTRAVPDIQQTYATLGSPMISTDMSGQLIGAHRDTALELATLDATQDYGAALQMATQGAPTFLDAATSPADTGAAYAGLGTDLDFAQRTAEQSALPGAAGLFPSAFGGQLGQAHQVDISGTKIYEE